MKRFADLYAALDQTTKTNEKVRALSSYFDEAPAEDAAWAVYFLTGRKLRQVIPPKKMRLWAAEVVGIEEWLAEECYHAVGDAAETIALLLPPAEADTEHSLAWWVRERLLPMREMEEDEQRTALVRAWNQLDLGQRLVWNKLLTGSFRVGVSQQLVIRGLAEHSGLETSTLAHRLMGKWEATPEFYQRLVSPDVSDTNISQPYPFFLAHPLEAEPHTLGDLADWQAEWKWDGIRAQLIRREGTSFLWSRGEELVTERYPEVIDASQHIPEGTVLDGELLPWKDGSVMPFGQLQRRIGRKTIGKKLLQEVPVVLTIYDLLEHDGKDIRDVEMRRRRALLEEILAPIADEPRLKLSPRIEAASWQHLEQLWHTSRDRQVEGMMLKRLDSPYRVGRQRGDWWKWKVAPFTVDAVLIYAQRGSGKRASLYTDYTFGVWDGGNLVPMAKAYSGLTDKEIAQVDAFIRRNTVERFGPVRTVKPELVFEIAFEGIQASTRHKSGIAVRFPRILRWRTDKTPPDADTLGALQKMLP